MTSLYKAGLDSNLSPYVDGPGDGLSYYGGTLWPHLRFNKDEDAERAAIIANTAYNAGYRQAQLDIRKALGIKEK